MAGLDSGLNLNAAYRQQYNGIPGAPVTQAFSADYNTGKRVGLGLIAYNDKAALINNTRFALTYAYHLPIGTASQQLHFGISGAFAHTQLDPKGIVGDQTDPAIADFNGRKNQFEVDYGMGYTDTHITLQASLSNLIGYMKHFNNTTADAATFYTAAAYKFIPDGDGPVNSIEPQVSFRGIKNYNSIVDVGANLVMFHHLLNIYGMYHTSGNFSAGVGVHYKDIVYIQGSYLSKTKGLRDYTDGNFEVDLTISLFRHR
jgi:type IX secretion system PorP/SprF family membrane protein